VYCQAPRNISRSARETNANIEINIVIHKGGKMSNFSVRAILVAAVLFSTALGGLLESAYDPECKREIENSADRANDM
jgi:hypothetical protein